MVTDNTAETAQNEVTEPVVENSEPTIAVETNSGTTQDSAVTNSTLVAEPLIDITIADTVTSFQEVTPKRTVTLKQMRQLLAARDMLLIKKDLLSNGTSNYLFNILVGSVHPSYGSMDEGSIRRMYRALDLDPNTDIEELEALIPTN